MMTMMRPVTQIQFSTTRQGARSKDCSGTSSNSSSAGCGGLVSSNSVHSTITATSDDKMSPPAANGGTKRVQFKGNVRVRKVSSHRMFSAEERKNMWYSSAECKEIRTLAANTVKRMMKGQDVDADEDDCSRGLEFKSPKKNKVRQKKKQTTIWAVIDEQDRFLEDNGYANGGILELQDIRDRDNAIAGVYREHSSKCATEAFNRGLKDAYIATKC